MLFNFLTVTMDDELLSEAWTSGDIYAIQSVVNFLGPLATWIISTVGFSIVIFAIIKNALSGLYCVNPRLWDRVDEIKNQGAEGLKKMGQGNAQYGKVLGVLGTFLGILPNVKALTDFADEDSSGGSGGKKDKKNYFIVSIAMLVFQVFIGMLIYYGYPTKIANWIGSSGTYVLAAVMQNHNPVETVKNLAGKIVIYSLSTDGSTNALDQHINNMTRDMMSVVNSKYKDMNKEPLQATALEIESKLQMAFSGNEIADILENTDGYSVAINASSTSVVPTYSAGYKDVGTGVYQASANSGLISYKYAIPVSSLPTGVPDVKPTDYITITVTVTPIASSGVYQANMILFGGIGNNPVSVSGEIKLRIDGITVGNGPNDCNGKLGNIVTVSAIKVEGDKHTVQQTFSAKLIGTDVYVTTGATPVLSFTSNNKDELIKYIQDSNVYFKVNLTGNWTYTIGNDTQKSTVKVIEWRLKPGVSTVTGAFTSWTDVDEKTMEGVQINSEMLKRTAMNETTNK